MKDAESTRPVVLTAPAKLTLSLRVVGVRADGYHLIDAEMITLTMHDTLAVTHGGQGLEVIGGGSDVSAGPDNLVSRALDLADVSAHVRLTKRIPSQAGLGGGSSDAGAVLRWANFDDLHAAANLGADVAFCMVGGRARVAGIGEIVESLPFEPRSLTLVTPPIKCPTPEVYRAWDELGQQTRGLSRNDLEPAAIAVAPELGAWRDKLWEETGLRPSLAGSGSTWFVAGSHPGPNRIVVEATPAGWEAPPD